MVSMHKAYTLTALLAKAADQFPHQKAVIVSGKHELLHWELQRVANVCAAQIRKAGIQPGDVVALTFPNSIEFVILFMAVIRARGVAAPLNTAYAAEKFKFYLKESKSKLLLLPSEGNAAAETAAINLKLPVVAARFHKSSVEFLPKSARFNICSSAEAEAIPLDNVEDDVALFLHTSRATSGLKGVSLTQQNLAASAEHIRETYELSASDVTVITLPVFTASAKATSTAIAEDEDAATADDAEATATSTVTATGLYTATATSTATAVNATKTTATSTATTTALFTSTATSTATASPPVALAKPRAITASRGKPTAITKSSAKPTIMLHIHGHDHHGLIAVLLSSLVSGATAVLPTAARFSASTFWNDMKAHGATWYTAVPTIHQILLDRHYAKPEEGYPKLRFIRSCGASLAPVILERLENAFGAPVLEAYAMTEASHQITSNPLPHRGQRKLGSVGKPTGFEIAILNEIGEAQPLGSSGEVCIRGLNVAKGYQDNPEANKTAFQFGWFHTGDLGYLDEEGYLFLVGKVKELLNHGGEIVSPLEVDGVLLSHPAVAEAVAFSVPNDKYDEEITAAAVIPREGATVNGDDIISHCKKNLAAFQIPRKVFVTDSLPKTASGKIKRRVMAEHFGVTSHAKMGAR